MEYEHIVLYVFYGRGCESTSGPSKMGIDIHQFNNQDSRDDSNYLDVDEADSSVVASVEVGSCLKFENI